VPFASAVGLKVFAIIISPKISPSLLLALSAGCERKFKILWAPVLSQRYAGTGMIMRHSSGRNLVVLIGLKKVRESSQIC
jgi:hypothetical protein